MPLKRYLFLWYSFGTDTPLRRNRYLVCNMHCLNILVNNSCAVNEHQIPTRWLQSNNNWKSYHQIAFIPCVIFISVDCSYVDSTISPVRKQGKRTKSSPPDMFFNSDTIAKFNKIRSVSDVCSFYSISLFKPKLFYSSQI